MQCAITQEVAQHQRVEEEQRKAAERVLDRRDELIAKDGELYPFRDPQAITEALNELQDDLGKAIWSNYHLQWSDVSRSSSVGQKVIDFIHEYWKSQAEAVARGE